MNKLVFTSLLLAGATAAHAAPCAPDNEWSRGTGTGTVNASASTNMNQLVFVPVGARLHARAAKNGLSVGTLTAGGNIENAPSVVELPSTDPPASRSLYVFVGSQDGYLYRQRIDATGNMVAAGMRDMRRPGCSTDAVEASPSIQLAAFSTGFVPNKDLVYVLTRYGCGDYSQNQVIALDANAAMIESVAPEWVFNQYGEYQMDYGSEGCSIDYDNNRIYCGTNLEPGRFQNTVWAINTNDGSLIWAHNYNSVRNRPQLGRGTTFRHLYVADALTNLHAVDPNTGVEHWNVLLSGSAGTVVTTNIWAEFRAPYDYMVFVTDSTGTLHAIYDGGVQADSGFSAWQQTFSAAPFLAGTKMTSFGTVSPTLGKMFVGLNDGTVRQLDLATGAVDATRLVSETTPTIGFNVSEPTIYLSPTAEDIDKMVVTAQAPAGGTTTEQFCVPMLYSSVPGLDVTNCTAAPGECKTFDSACATGECYIKAGDSTGTCFARPKPDGTPCSDKEVCTQTDICRKGACVGTNWDAGNSRCTDGTVCATNPAKGCGKDACVKGPMGQWQCADVSGNVDFCGGPRTCKRVGTYLSWYGDRLCKNHNCVRAATGICNLPADADFQNRWGTVFDENITWLDFDNRTGAGGTKDCNAWATTYYGNSSTCVATGDGSTATGQCLNQFTSSQTNVAPTAGAILNCPGNTTTALCSNSPWFSTRSVCIGGPTGCTPLFVDIPFVDPSPPAVSGSTNNKIVRIEVVVKGKRHCFTPNATANGCTTCTSTTTPISIHLNATNLIATGTTASTSTCCSGTAGCRTLFDSWSTSTWNAPAGFPGYQKLGPGNPGNNSIRVSVPASATNGWDIAALTVTVYDNLGRNWVRRLSPPAMDGVPEIPTVPRPGYMNGISVSDYQGGMFSGWSDSLTAFVNSTTMAHASNFASAGRTDNDAFLVRALNIGAGLPALATSCLGGSCTPIYRQVAAFNEGVGPPATNGASPASGALKMFFPNYRANGDVYQFVPAAGGGGVMNPSALWSGTFPPWCDGMPCTTRVTNVDMLEVGRFEEDGLLRIAYGHKLFFWDLTAQRFTKCADLGFKFCSAMCNGVADCPSNTVCTSGRCVPPSSCMVNPDCPLGTECNGGSCKSLERWPGSRNIDRILSMSADPLNKLNDTILEVSEDRGSPFYYTVQVRGDDLSVRPLQNIGTISGVYKDMQVSGAPRPTKEVRSTAAAQQKLYRFTPVDPTSAQSTGVSSFDLYP